MIDLLDTKKHYWYYDMWLLTFISDEMANIFFGLGILGVIVSLALNFLPFVAKYRAAIQIISTVVLICTSWIIGGKSIQQEYEIKELETKVKIANLEKQVAESEKKASDINAKTEIVYRDRVQVVKDVQVVVQEKIKDVSINIDSKCKITPETIDILNSSAKNITPVNIKLLNDSAQNRKEVNKK